MWSSRDEWAKERRSLYADEFPDISDVLSDYASPEEIANLRGALLARRKTYPVESYERGGVNNALRTTANNNGAADIFAPFLDRWRAAQAAAIENARRERASLPIDDEEWAAELKRRAEVDAYLNRSPVRDSA